MISRLTENTIVRSAMPAKASPVASVDVTPVMNMFVILIPFLVSMAVFTHLAVIQFSLPPSSGNGRGPDREGLALTVVVTPERIALTRGEQILFTLAGERGGYDYPRFSTLLRAAREQFAGNPDTVVIAVADALTFEDVVHCMDACREAGFAGISLAEGTAESIEEASSDGVDDD